MLESLVLWESERWNPDDISVRISNQTVCLDNH